MVKIGFFNNKGGVGKTTGVTNTAYAIAETGKRVLVVDCDSQRNSSQFFTGGNINTATDTKHKNLKIDVWHDNEDVDDYDYVLFDLPPAMNDFTNKVLAQCGSVFIPIDLSMYAVQGVSTAVKAVDDSGAKLGGVYIAKYNKKSTSDNQILPMLSEMLGDKLLDTVIPFSNVIANSTNLRLTAFEYMKWTSAATSFGDLTAEIMERSAGYGKV